MSRRTVYPLICSDSSIYYYAKGKFVLAPTLTNHRRFQRSFACTLYVIPSINFINFSTLLSRTDEFEDFFVRKREPQTLEMQRRPISVQQLYASPLVMPPITYSAAVYSQRSIAGTASQCVLQAGLPDGFSIRGFST